MRQGGPAGQFEERHSVPRLWRQGHKTTVRSQVSSAQGQPTTVPYDAFITTSSLLTRCGRCHSIRPSRNPPKPQETPPHHGPSRAPENHAAVPTVSQSRGSAEGQFGACNGARSG